MAVSKAPICHGLIVYPAAKVACIYFERLFVILRMGNFWVALKFIFEKMRRMQPFDVFSPFP
jgi:hypothetical protein